MKLKRKIKNFLMHKLFGKCDLDLLIRRGLRVGSNFHMLPECIIDESHCWLISIGDNVTLAPQVHLLAHDASTKMFLGYTKIGRVTIGNRVFIGAGSIVLPNVSIGDNVIIGAGSVVTKSIPDHHVAAGNPAKVICTLEEYLEKNSAQMRSRPVYDAHWTLGNITDEMKEQMVKDLSDGIGYVI